MQKTDKVYKEFHVSWVQEKFYEVFLKYTSKENAVNLFADVYKNYSSKSRHYHNMQHIFGMVSCWENKKSELINPDEIFMAIIYHDIIYKPTREDNEKKSAEYFYKNVAPLLAVESSLRVLFIPKAILATKHDGSHMESYRSDVEYLLDFDLHVLGTPHESEYEWYRTGIRKEYKIFPDLLYKPGRKKVLENFLNRKNIFLTKYYQQDEKKARKNLKREINSYLC